MLAWLAARHPATREASCIQNLIPFDYEYYFEYLAQVRRAGTPRTLNEWSSPLVEADAINEEWWRPTLPHKVLQWRSSRKLPRES